MLAEKISDHLKNLAKKNPAIKRQFYLSKWELHTKEDKLNSVDPLLEDEHTKKRGLIYKYRGRVLILLTLPCAAYCRFCTRRRCVSEIEKGILSKEDIDNIAQYIKQ